MKPALQLIAAREGRSTASLVSHITERVISEMVRQLVDDEPELGVELEKHGVLLRESDRLQFAIAEVVQ